jgi:hypothetical protein
VGVCIVLVQSFVQSVVSHRTVVQPANIFLCKYFALRKFLPVNVEVRVVDRVYLLGMAEFIYGRKNESSEFNIFEHVRCLEWGG